MSKQPSSSNGSAQSEEQLKTAIIAFGTAAQITKLLLSETGCSAERAKRVAESIVEHRHELVKKKP